MSFAARFTDLARKRLKEKLTPRYFLRREVDPERKVRLCHLVEDLQVGEVANEVLHISNNLSPAEVLAGVLCLGARGYPAQRVEPRVQVWALHGPSVATPRVVWSVARELREYGIHVLHTHGWHALLVGAAAARVAGVPHVIHTEYHAPPEAAGELERRAEAHAAAAVQAWTAATEPVAKALARRMGLAEGQPVLVPRSVNTDIFRPPLERELQRGVLGIDGAEVVIGTVGPLAEHKRQAWLLEAAAALLAEGINVRLLVVGDGPDRERLEALAAELNLGNRCRFTGFVGDMPAMLSAMDLYVHTAGDEGVPVAALEAMAFGLPVVAADEGAIGELLQDSQTGVLFRPGGAADLADRLRPVLGEREKWLELGNQARLVVERRNHAGLVVGQYWELYEGLLGCGRLTVDSPRSTVIGT